MDMDTDTVETKRINPNQKRILVTGAASGIGKNICEEYLRKGCFVYATDINESLLKESFIDNKNVKCLKLDITNQENITNVFDIIKNDGKGLFGLVNNAGISKYPGSKESLFKICCEYDVDKEVLPVIDINLVGLIRMTTKFIPILLENKDEKPCLINIASVAGLIGPAGFGIYSSTKFAVVGYSDCLRREISERVRVICVEPGFVNTQMVQSELLDNFSFNEKSNFLYRLLKFGESIQNYKKYSKYWAMNPRIISKTVFRETFSNPSNNHIVADNIIMKHLWIILSYLPSKFQDFLMKKVL